MEADPPRRRGPRPPSLPFGARSRSGSGSQAPVARRGPRPPSTPFRRGPRPPSTPFRTRRGPRPPSTEFTGAMTPYAGEEEEPESQASGENGKKAGIAAKAGRVGAKAAGKVHKQIRKKHACERACICAFAVSLLWVTSLAMSQALVKYFIRTPSVDGVLNIGERFLNETKNQRRRYETCAIETSKTCRREYNRELEEEDKRVVRSQEILQRRIDEYRNELVVCQDTYSDAVKILELLETEIDLTQDTYRKTENRDNPLCKGRNFGDYASQEAISAAALSDVESFKGTADGTVNTLEGRLQARADYDIDYFGNKVDEKLPGFKAYLDEKLQDPESLREELERDFKASMACIQESGVYDGVACEEGIPIFARVRNKVLDTREQYIAVRTRVERYRNEVYEKLNEFEELYNIIYDVYKALSDADLVLLFGDWRLVGPGSFFDGLGVWLGINIDDLLPDTEAMKRQVEAEMQKHADEILAQVQKIENLNGDFKAATDDLVATVVVDYDPPPVDDDGSYDKSSDSIISKMTSELGAVSPSDKDVPALVERFEDPQLNATEASSELLEKADPRTWDFYQYEDTIFARFQDGFQSLNDYALAFDYAFRILKSLFLIRKYWNISAVSTPPADVRTKAGINAGLFTAKRNIIQTIGHLLTHPAVNLVLICVFLGFFSSAFYVAYQPLYSEYTAGCVNSCWTDIKNNVRERNGELRFPSTGNGTMLYRNAFAVSEQYAFTDGDYVASTEIDALNVERELTCKDEVVSSLDVQLRQDDYFDFYASRQVYVRDKLEVIRTCIDTDKIKAEPLFQARLRSWAQPPSNLTLQSPLEESSPLCRDEFQPLDDLIEELNKANPEDTYDRNFQCSRIEPCAFDCNGPSEEVLRGISHDSMCTAEWFGHASSLGFVLTILVFFLINLSRYIFMRGIVKIFWRHLVTNRFSYLASCTEAGHVLYPEAVTEKGESFRHLIRKQLRVALRRFEREGYLEVFFSLVFNAPWIVALVVLGNTLEFSISKTCE